MKMLREDYTNRFKGSGKAVLETCEALNSPSTHSSSPSMNRFERLLHKYVHRGVVGFSSNPNLEVKGFKRLLDQTLTIKPSTFNYTTDFQ